MRILIAHLTRMHGGHICVAGVDMRTGKHIRPVLANESLPFYLLAGYGGPFEMNRIIDLGFPRYVGEAPHVEDYVFIPSQARLWRLAASHEFWGMIEELQRPRLCDIFGVELHAAGNKRYAAALGQGTASLGFLRPARPPELYLARKRDGMPQVRIRFGDGRVKADAGVTDLRLFGDDHATPDAARVRAAAQWIRDSRQVILGVGLTRKYRPADNLPYFHWLQVNNIHLQEMPTWPVG